MLLVPQVVVGASTGIRSFDAREVLRELVDVYGRELGPVLLAIGDVESHLDPDAHVVNESEDSRGAFQVNVRQWGESAAPIGAAVGATPLERIKAQVRAMRSVVDDAAAGAREISASTGARFADAFNLVWQWGRARARQLVGGAAWSIDAIASRIRMLKDEAAAAAWRVRDTAFRSAYEAALLALEAAINLVVPGGVKGLELGGFLLLLLLWFLFSSKERRARTTRYASTGARAAARLL